MIRFTLLPAFLMLLTACGPEEYTWNQRMTLTVETPDGIVTGSSVIEVNATYCPDGCGLARDSIGSFNYRGEAVAVEVLPGRWLFALIGNPGEFFYRARPDLFGDIRRSDRGEWARLIPDVTEAVELLPDHVPTLVAFGDINDPRTAVEVDPDDLSAIFGDGAILLNSTIEITQDLPTIGRLRNILVSLGEFPEQSLVIDRDPMDSSFPATLLTGYFIRD